MHAGIQVTALKTTKN